MTCYELANRLSELNPNLAQVEIARLALLILSQTPDSEILEDNAALLEAWRNATFRLEAAADQHSAVTEELESLCSGGAIDSSHEQLWALLRAIKVQSQILELYCDPPKTF